MLIKFPASLLDSFIRSSSYFVYMDYLGFSLYRIMSYTNQDVFILSMPIWRTFILFLAYLLCLRHIWRAVVWMGIFDYWSSVARVQSITIEYEVSCTFPINTIILRKYLFSPTAVNVFVMIDFVKYPFCIYWDNIILSLPCF